MTVLTCPFRPPAVGDLTPVGGHNAHLLRLFIAREEQLLQVLGDMDVIMATVVRTAWK